MNPRNTLILFVVALVVVGGVWWNENVRKAQVEEAEAEARSLFPDLVYEDLRWIELETTDGRPARLEFAEGAWRLSQPVSSPVDRTAVDGVVAAIVETKSAGVIESPQAPEVYGLGDRATRVRFGTEASEHELRVGGKTPVGGNEYAAHDGSDAVFTVPSFRASALRRSLVELREKRVLRFDRTAIDRVELAWAGGGATLEKGDGDAWRLVAPIEDAADSTTVDALLSDLSFLRAEAFVDRPGGDAEVGLDRPAFEAKLTAPPQEEGGAPTVFHLKVGAETEDGRHRMVRAREHALYLVPVDRALDFPQRVAAYRFKELARFEPGDAKQLEIAFHDPAAGAHVLIAEHGEDGWSSSPDAVAPGKAARMVAELATLRAEDIVADAMGVAEQKAVGLDPPSVRFRVRGAGEGDAEGPLLAEVLLGSVDADRGIVARSADRERIYRIDYELAEHLPVSAEAFRNRFLSKEEPAGEPAPAP